MCREKKIIWMYVYLTISLDNGTVTNFKSCVFTSVMDCRKLLNLKLMAWFSVVAA